MIKGNFLPLCETPSPANLAQLVETARKSGWQRAAEEVLGKSVLDFSNDRQADGWILTSLGSESRVLDLGCGLGFLSFQLAQVASCVYAADPSPLSLEFINIRKTQDGVTNVFPVLSERTHFAFEDNSLDLAILHDGIVRDRHFAEVLAEIRRLLKLSGEICLILEGGGAPALLRTSKLTANAGFSSSRLFSPLPDYRHALYILDLDRPDAFPYLVRSLSLKFSGALFKKKYFLTLLAKLALHLRLYRWKIFRYFCFSWILVAAKISPGTR